MYKIIGTDGQQYGPISIERLRIWIAENRVHKETLVQPEGAQGWKPLNAFPELASELKPPLAAAAPPASTVAARASNKIPAGVCGILLGSLGIHKFILGFNGAGIIMLLVTLIGGLLTCGIASGVMHLIGLIEGIIYLTKSDEEFVRLYVDGRKGWF